tara:strand:+ start:5731 stop:6174 length:444 start_codon:yes stop_codon:yes gene_type:complete
MANIESFISKHKISNVYRYAETNIAQAKEISFGWVRTDVIDLNNPVILSYPSKSKKFSVDLLEWSNKEGTSAVGLSDYSRYFLAVTSKTPDEFMTVWQDKRDEFTSGKSLAGEKMDHEYIFCLAELLSFGKKFILGGRIFKLINNNT